MSRCISCDLDGSGTYCSNCGEILQPKRLSFKDVFHDFFSNVLQLDGPLILTVKTLLVAPGELLTQYFKGVRKKYYKPLALYALVVSVYYLVFYAVGLDNEAVLMHFNGSEQGDGVSKEIQTWNQNFLEFLRTYLKFIGVAIIPFQVIVTRWFVKLRSLNFIETLVMWLYINSILTLSGFITMWLTFINVSWYYNCSFALNILYVAYVFKNFFQYSWLKAIIKSVLVSATAFLLIMLIMIFLGMIVFFVRFT